MSIKLKELIRAVRACKTAAEERGVITKECALIRTAIKNADKSKAGDEFMHRNCAKLMYIQMLGYPTHFGQMAPLKLIATPNFPEKRLGYLTLMSLLDENTNVLMLATNSIKNDLTHKNPYVVGLALTVLADISSDDMCRDLANEVEKLFSHGNPYIRKKAALCAVRTVRKVPELIDDFVPAALQLLNDKTHAVLLTGITLIIDMIKINRKCLKKMKKLTPSIVRLLKNLVMAGYVAEYDVVGITDPFLQVRIIELLRLLGHRDANASDEMNDILAQVALNTEPTKNPGNAILYACVQTIMTIEAEAGLRVLAINILGRFLLNRDNNIRYVALNTLVGMVGKDTQAIQRHRNTIVECLKDSDISIRRRALELIYALVGKSNVRALVKELLTYLALAGGEQEFKRDLTEKICLVVERHAPSVRWHIDTLISVLVTAGDLAPEDVSTKLILLISRSKDLTAYATHKLFAALKRQQSGVVTRLLSHVVFWCVGEYGEQLVSPDGTAQANATEGKDLYVPQQRSAVLEQCQSVMAAVGSTSLCRQYVLTAVVKLTQRFAGDAGAVAQCKKLLKTYNHSMNVELQQRSVEYTVIAGADLDGIRAGVVGRMPVLDASKDRARRAALEDKNKADAEEEESEEESEEEESEEEDSDDDSDDSSDESSEEEEAPKKKKGGKKAAAAAAAAEKKKNKKGGKKAADAGGGLDLLDLDIFGGDGGDGGASSKSNNNSSSSNNNSSSSGGGGGMDLLGDIFGGGGGGGGSSSNSGGGGGGDIMDIFGGGGGGGGGGDSGATTIPCFASNGLTVKLSLTKPQGAASSLTKCTASFSNSTGAAFTNFDFKVAVPKWLTLSMQPASSSTVPANSDGAVTQVFTLDNSKHGKKTLLVRVKIDYVGGGGKVSEPPAAVNTFPEGY